jgi:hypothetical protein
LERICLIPCDEYDNLRRAIAKYNKVAERSSASLSAASVDPSWTWVVAYHCDVRSLTGKNAPFDRPPDAGCNEHKGFDPWRRLR